jgi:hypothetical protein
MNHRLSEVHALLQTLVETAVGARFAVLFLA